VLCSLKDLRLVTLVLLVTSPGTNGLTLSPLEDQDSFLDLSPPRDSLLDLSPRSDRQTGRIARTETATPARKMKAHERCGQIIKVFEVL
jgi:hypothetical protein